MCYLVACSWLTAAVQARVGARPLTGANRTFGIRSAFRPNTSASLLRPDLSAAYRASLVVTQNCYSASMDSPISYPKNSTPTGDYEKAVSMAEDSRRYQMSEPATTGGVAANARLQLTRICVKNRSPHNQGVWQCMKAAWFRGPAFSGNVLPPFETRDPW